MPADVVIGAEEEPQVRSELAVAAVAVAADGGILRRPVEPLDLVIIRYPV